MKAKGKREDRNLALHQEVCDRKEHWSKSRKV